MCRKEYHRFQCSSFCGENGRLLAELRAQVDILLFSCYNNRFYFLIFCRIDKAGMITDCREWTTWIWKPRLLSGIQVEKNHHRTIDYRGYVRIVSIYDRRKNQSQIASIDIDHAHTYIAKAK